MHDGIPLSPAEVGTLIDEKIDSRDITSAIVDLAVRGYIKINEIRKEGLLFDTTDYYLEKVKEPDPALSTFEVLLMKYLFSQGGHGIRVSEMKNRFYKNLGIIEEALYEGLVKKGYFIKSPDRVRDIYTIAGFVLFLLVTVLGGIYYAIFSPGGGGKNFVAGIMAGLPVVAFGRFMPAKTLRGVNARIHIIGFREFLNRAEKDRLERMNDRDLFSKFLLYAIALDVVDNWAEAFESIYQNPPDWYVSAGGFRTFSPYRFSNSISAMTSSIGSAIFSAPRVSGSGGEGGFSGGGFGGGGGGSW